MEPPIPSSPQEMAALLKQPVDEDVVAAAIAGTIQIARAEGKSLTDLTAEVLKDDQLLDPEQRQWLSTLVAQAWENLPL